jgi:hypothetical protein
MTMSLFDRAKPELGVGDARTEIMSKPSLVEA